MHMGSSRIIYSQSMYACTFSLYDKVISLPILFHILGTRYRISHIHTRHNTSHTAHMYVYCWLAAPPVAQLEGTCACLSTGPCLVGLFVSFRCLHVATLGLHESCVMLASLDPYHCNSDRCLPGTVGMAYAYSRSYEHCMSLYR